MVAERFYHKGFPESTVLRWAIFSQRCVCRVNGGSLGEAARGVSSPDLGRGQLGPPHQWVSISDKLRTKRAGYDLPVAWPECVAKGPPSRALMQYILSGGISYDTSSF